LGRAAQRQHGSFPLLPPFTHWARHTPTPFPSPPFPHWAHQMPTLLQPAFGPPPSLMGHGQVARISRVWGVIPYSPVFPPLHPVTTPSSWALHTPTLPLRPPSCSLGLQLPRPFLNAACMGACPLRGHPSPSFTDYMRLCMGDMSPPWTHT
jgi:hypothetical protein